MRFSSIFLLETRELNYVGPQGTFKKVFTKQAKIEKNDFFFHAPRIHNVGYRVRFFLIGAGARCCSSEA